MRVFAAMGRVTVVAIAMALTVAACGDATDERGEGMTTTTTATGEAFRAAVEDNDLDALVTTLADDIELYSPVLADPFVGKETVSRLFAVLIDVFEDIEITDEFRNDDRYAMSFTARVGTEPVRVVDLLSFDGDGRINEFVVTMRPLAGINALSTAVSPHLETILGG